MPSTGDKILASSIDSLFSRLEEIRVAHNNDLQTAEVKEILSQPFNTESVKDKRTDFFSISIVSFDILIMQMDAKKKTDDVAMSLS